MNESIKYFQTAHELISHKKYEDALKESLKAAEISPLLINLYQNAYIYTKLGEYHNAIDILMELINSGKADVFTFGLLGNNYDYTGNAEKSVNSYKEGLEKFPYSGYLNHELGVSFMNAGRINEALNCFIEGILKEPAFNGNYLSAGKAFISSSETVWGFIYLDIYSMMENTTGNYEDVGSILYNNYQKAYIKNEDGNRLSFYETEDDRLNGYKFDREYEIFMNLSFSGKAFDSTIKQLNALRKNFIISWFNNNMNEKFPNPLFDAQKLLIDHGYFELMNYSLFRNINKPEFEEFVKENANLIQEFNEFNESEGIYMDLSKPIVRGMF